MWRSRGTLRQLPTRLLRPLKTSSSILNIEVLGIQAKVLHAKAAKLIEENKALAAEKALLETRLFEATTEKDKEAAKAGEVCDRVQRAETRLAKEQSKVTDLELKVKKLEIEGNTLAAEKESLEIGLKKELESAKKAAAVAKEEAEVAKREAEVAKKDAAEADDVSQEWRAAKEMCQNLVANLHDLAAPTLPAEAESQYQGWLELIGLEVGDPKEMAFISPEDYASEEDVQGKDDTSALNEGSTQVGDDNVTVVAENDKS